MYLYINKNTCHKNQFVNLAKLQQRLGYPQELNCSDFNEEIRKQKVLRKRLQAIENYNNLVEYYEKAKKQVSRRDFITAELKDIQQKISDRRADNDLIKRTKSLLGLQKNYDTNALNNDGQYRAFILDLIDNKIKAQPLTIIEEKISQLGKNIKEDVKKYRQNILDYINATEHQTNDIIKLQTQNRKLEQNIAKELNGFNRFCRNKLKLSKEDITQFKKRTAQHQTRSQLQNTSATEQQYQQIQPQTHHNMAPQQQEPVQNQHNFSPEFIKIKKMLANKLNEDETKNVKQNSNIRQKTGITGPGI